MKRPTNYEAPRQVIFFCLFFFLLLRYQYIPQHPILEKSEIMFYLQYSDKELHHKWERKILAMHIITCSDDWRLIYQSMSYKCLYDMKQVVNQKVCNCIKFYQFKNHFLHRWDCDPWSKVNSCFVVTFLLFKLMRLIHLCTSDLIKIKKC